MQPPHNWFVNRIHNNLQHKPQKQKQIKDTIEIQFLPTQQANINSRSQCVLSTKDPQSLNIAQ